MDEHRLRAFHQATQPILQRTAPVQAQARLPLTPPVLDQVAWGIVLAYVANVSERPPGVIPRRAQSGEGPLGDEEVRSALEGLQQASVQPKLRPRPPAMARFGAAVRRLLDAYGWTPQRAAQVADEVSAALQAITR